MKKALLLFQLLFTQGIAAQSEFAEKLSEAAIGLTKEKVVYDPSYFTIPYPNGDVPSSKGVCADVVIRAYRKLGIDLQVLVHKDMQIAFSIYPKRWGLTSTDKNIDHRRVPNLMKFFERNGITKKITNSPTDYTPGDIVCWLINDKLPHIGIVTNKKSTSSNCYMIVHNVGGGQVLDDCLFRYKIVGHYAFTRLLHQ